jgi:HD superfamily phosphohydrolase
MSPESQPTIADRPFVIRDPVHGYLVVAAHERIVVDDPVTQRLRRITQTGLAEHVFPEARTSRFVHSLGAMHLASRFVLSALENADEEVAVRFFDDIEGRVPKYSGVGDTVAELLQQDGTLSALATVRSSFRHPALRSPRIRELMAVVEASLRLAALFHDLGHFPFSHDVEYAIKDYAALQESEKRRLPESFMAIAGAEAPHEEIGHRLAELVFQSLAAGISPAVRAAFEMATAILNTKIPKYDLQKRPHATTMQWLHSLVDGEIDADRADYLLRDGRALGLDFAHYDVDRLVSNLVLIYHPDLGFITAVKETGLAALESYCLSRSRSNQVFVRHHKVAQASAALRHASVKAFGRPEVAPFVTVIEEMGAASLTGKSGLLRSLALFDDGWWIQALREMQKHETDTLTRSCLELTLDRGRTLKSSWKRRGDLTDDHFKAINSKVDDLIAPGSGPIRLANKRRQLLREGILITPFKFKPYARREPDKKSVMMIKGKDRTEPASAVSSLIDHLQDAWDRDVHLYAFVDHNSSLSLENVVGAVLEE